ncbi:hypothetical protein GW17_00030451 [Ensete ventricosum]|nr:hypothetical protein GW17_00030451 [Ensete ventricosum]
MHRCLESKKMVLLHDVSAFQIGNKLSNRLRGEGPKTLGPSKRRGRRGAARRRGTERRRKADRVRRMSMIGSKADRSRNLRGGGVDEGEGGGGLPLHTTRPEHKLLVHLNLDFHFYPSSQDAS